MDKYENFVELKRYEIENRDYRIRVRRGLSGIAILAPHGGRIERGTSQIASAIAGKEHTLYCFEGIKPRISANRDLHITSNNYDEPEALAVVSEAEGVIAIHGARGMGVAAYAGGLDLSLRARVLDSLNRLQIMACDDPSPTRQGKGTTNICNRGKSGRGLQLELTFGLRKLMFGPAGKDGLRPSTELLDRFAYGVRSVL